MTAEIRLRAARSASASAEDLDNLIVDPSPEVRVAVCRNPGATVAQLKRLAADDDLDVRREAFGELGVRGVFASSIFDSAEVRFDSGAFGDIYRIVDRNGEIFAKKVFSYKGLPEHLDISRQRFIRGATLMKDYLADADRIARVYSVDDSDAVRPCFTMEFVDGPDLASLVSSPERSCRRLGVYQSDTSRVPIPVLAQVLVDMCDALTTAHSRDIVHRDVKPRNVVTYVERGRVRAKLTDFDLAYIPAYKELTGSATVVFGTHFSPPWLQRTSINASLLDVMPREDARCIQIDDYGVAATIMFAFTGSLPAPGLYTDGQVNWLLQQHAGRRRAEAFEVLLKLVKDVLSSVRPDEVLVSTRQFRQALQGLLVPKYDVAPVKAVFAFSRSSDRETLRTDKEIRAVEAEKRPGTPLDGSLVLTATSPKDLHNALMANRDTRMLWFSGHGASGQFFFEDGSGRSVAIDVTGLEFMIRPFLAPRGALQCIVLNCCRTGDLAQHLSKQLRVPFVVHFMQDDLPDDVALAFAEGFIGSLNAGDGYKDAYGHGRARAAGISTSDAQHYELSTIDFPVLVDRGAEASLASVRKAEEPARVRGDAFRHLVFVGVRDVAKAQLRSADLTNVDASYVLLPNSSLQRAKATNASFAHGDLSGSDCTEINLGAANLNRASATRCRFQGAVLNGANANDFTAQRSDFRSSQWREVTATACDCSRSSFERADLSRANLSRGVFEECKFCDASLVGTILSRSVMIGCDLTGADLRHADFSRTDLRGADLSNALNVEHAKFFRPTYDEATRWPDSPTFVLPTAGDETYTA